MTIKSIKAGRWYETNLGSGVCLSVGGTFPPSVKIDIKYPFPRGPALVRPRDVRRELSEPEMAEIAKL